MTKPERKQFILDKLRTAMAAIQNDPKYDWGRESESICEAAVNLMESAHKFIDGKVTEEEIKPLYRQYVGLYAR